MILSQKNVFKHKNYFLIFIILAKASLSVAFDEFLLDPLEQINFRCAGQGINDVQCISGLCYDAFNIQNDSVSIGCATTNMCKTAGCVLNEADNLFICCCANTYCNGKSQRLVKARWQMYKNGNYRPKNVEQTNSSQSVESEKRLLNTRNVANQDSNKEIRNVSLTTTIKSTTLTATTKPINITKNNSPTATNGQINIKVFINLETSKLPLPQKQLKTTILKSATPKTPKITTKVTGTTTKSSKPTTNKLSAKVITTSSSTITTTNLPSNGKVNTTSAKTTTKKTLLTSTTKIPNAKVNQTKSPTTKKPLQQKTTTKKINITTTQRPHELPEYITTGLPEYKTSKSPINTTYSKATKVQSTHENLNKTIKTESKVATTTQKVYLSTKTTPIKNDDKNKQKITTKGITTPSSNSPEIKKIIIAQQMAAKPVNDGVGQTPASIQTTTTETTTFSPKFTSDLKSKVDDLAEIVLQKSAVFPAEFGHDKTTRSFISTSTSTTRGKVAINRHKDYRSFAWYFVVVFGFIVSVIIFAIVYFSLRKCGHYSNWPGKRSGPRESLQRIRDHDGADDEICENERFRNNNFSSEHSSANLLKSKKSPKRRSSLFTFRPNKSKNGLLLKPNTTNDSLASHCTTITTISAFSNTSPIKKNEKSPTKSSSGKSTPSKSRALDADRELTVIDPFLNKQYTGTIHIVEPPESKITKN